ncbi:hypothetical protein E2C01_022770 [Portunus trituberculatus]|uniref:Uncharacterized protein n=1 Tax=Portunus trituberculatus TaxID=210409 RepID=A0A5B7E6A1_PORTR|nr:hypothetical protein [Portunus trituberculatus]
MEEETQEMKEIGWIRKDIKPSPCRYVWLRGLNKSMKRSR